MDNNENVASIILIIIVITYILNSDIHVGVGMAIQLPKRYSLF